MASSPQTLLGFDFGTKRIGIAVGQTLTQQARPLRSVYNKQNIPDWDEILSIVKEWEPHALVVGLPLSMDGTDQAMTDRARHFSKTLSEKTNLPVLNTDERLTTLTAKAEAFDQLGSKGLEQADIDSHAAKILLESFLQSYTPGDTSR